MFLLDYAYMTSMGYFLNKKKKKNFFKTLFFIFIADDIKLNSSVFYWPEYVMQVLEKNQVRLQALREKTEEKLRERIQKFDEKLKDLLKRVELYKQIGVRIKLNFILLRKVLNYINRTKFFANLEER